MSSKNTTIILACNSALAISLAFCFGGIQVIVGALSIVGIFILHCFMRWKTEE